MGSMISFNTKGLDFCFNCPFCGNFVGQWKAQKNHKPAIIGVLCSVICLVIFGPSNFIIPAMIAILAVLTISRKEYLVEKELAEKKLAEEGAQ